MKTLIVVASRHGATTGIADALARELRKDGHTADVTSVADAPPLAGYEAVVVGSAVYFGKWLKEARQYVEHHEHELARMPVWLFSSGPTTTATPQSKDDPPGIAALVQRIGARGHRTFVGKLDPTQLGLGERFVIWNVNRIAHDTVPGGDFRDWSAIRQWADEIAAALPVATPSP